MVNIGDTGMIAAALVVAQGAVQLGRMAIAKAWPAASTNGRFTHEDRARLEIVSGVMQRTDEDGAPLVYASRSVARAIEKQGALLVSLTELVRNLSTSLTTHQDREDMTLRSIDRSITKLLTVLGDLAK